MMCEHFAAEGTGALHDIDDIIMKEKYVEIMKSNILKHQ